MEYEIIRSGRRTLTLQIKGGRVIVRAPFSVSEKQIADFVSKNSGWIEKHLEKAVQSSTQKLTETELAELYEKARTYIPQRAAYYAPLVGVSCGRISIRCQRTKWGSCSGKGNLNFNCLLMLAPPEVIDSVVVHELCHLKHMDHSERFYAEVLRVLPDYRSRYKWLRDNGAEIMNRL
ncbi:MAG: M48 family metallopeptidase [Oscillospiraceae bacterium]|nr:M48 family metallopeptidase [Oscillospiraceae bacterium]